jgi:hypothetical protein
MVRRIFFFFVLVSLGRFASAESKFMVTSRTIDTTMSTGAFRLKALVVDESTGEPLPFAVLTDHEEKRLYQADIDGNINAFLILGPYELHCKSMGYNEAKIMGPFASQEVIEAKIIMDEYELYLKPVVYAYNAGSEITLSLKPKGHFTFTYPHSEGNWRLTTNPDGSLTDVKTGKTHPYVFWEGSGTHSGEMPAQVEGFLIKTDTSLVFLENILSAYGLNEKESADFITFWVPRMIVKEYAMVRFISTGSYGDQIAEIDVRPEPDSILRLYMYLTPLDSPVTGIEIKQPQIDVFDRKGFILVEWGRLGDERYNRHKLIFCETFFLFVRGIYFFRLG